MRYFLFKILYPFSITAAFGDICLAAANNCLVEAVMFLVIIIKMFSKIFNFNNKLSTSFTIVCVAFLIVAMVINITEEKIKRV